MGQGDPIVQPQSLITDLYLKAQPCDPHACTTEDAPLVPLWTLRVMYIIIE